MRRPSRRIVWGISALWIGGCHAWRGRPVMSPTIGARTLRVTTDDGRRLTLERAVVRSDSVVGYVAEAEARHRNEWQADTAAFGARTAVPVDDVAALEERRVSGWRTVGLIVGVTVVALLIAAAAIVGAMSDPNY